MLYLGLDKIEHNVDGRVEAAKHQAGDCEYQVVSNCCDTSFMCGLERGADHAGLLRVAGPGVLQEPEDAGHQNTQGGHLQSSDHEDYTVLKHHTHQPEEDTGTSAH